MKLKEVIEEGGYNYMEEVRNGSSIREMAREIGYLDCEICGEWIDPCDMFVTSGIADIDICEHCFYKYPEKSEIIEAKKCMDKEDQSY